MQFDWFTIIAQIINFLILVGLLRYFLYDRIIEAMDAREARIAARLTEAEQQRAAAEGEAEEFRHKNQQLDTERHQLLMQAREAADTRRKELIAEARDEVEQMRNSWKEAVQRERQTFLKELRQRIGRQVHATARYALADLADADLEQRIVQVFLSKLRELNAQEREMFAAAIRQSEKVVKVYSAFELAGETRRQLADSLQATFTDGFKIEFATSSDLVCGIELRAQSRKITWSLEDYLATLEEDLATALDEDANVSSAAAVTEKRS